MKRVICNLALVSSLIAVAICHSAGAGEQQIVLQEHVNRQWNNELLSFPFEAPGGACHPDSVRLRGPDGPMAVQLSNIETCRGPERSSRPPCGS